MKVERAKLDRVWKQVNFAVLDSGLARLDREWQCQGIRSPYTRLYYIADGEGWVACGGERVQLTAGNVYLVPADAELRYGCPERMTQLYFHLNAITADGYDLFSRCSRMLCHPSEQAPSTLAEDYSSGDVLRVALLRSVIEADLWRFIDAADLGAAVLRLHSHFLEQVFTAVRENLSSSLTIGRVAELTSMPESTLAKRFRREFGINLGRYVDDMLFHEICRRFTATENSLGEIADQLGFCDQFYLTRFFKSRVGETPSRYRAHLRGEI